MGGYAVGSESTLWPKNVGTFLPPGGAIGFQAHYTPFGKEVTDKSILAAPMAELELGFWRASVVTRSMAGARDALGACRRLGIAMAVVSNSSFSDAVIRSALARYFGSCVATPVGQVLM